MTFLAQDTSQRAGQPIYLYVFTADNAITRMSNSQAGVIVGGFTYPAETIRHDEPRRTYDKKAEQVKIELPITSSVAQEGLDLVPVGGVLVEISQYHRTDVTEEVRGFFRGNVRSWSFNAETGMVEMLARGSFVDLQKETPRDTFQGPCNNLLGDGQCKVNVAGFSSQLTVASLVSNVYTITGLSAAGGGDDTYFAGGVMTAPNNRDKRTIIQVSGDEARIVVPFPTSAVNAGSLVTVAAGCDHTIATCDAKFSNALNYGGCAFVPDRNIFGTGLT